MPSKKKPPHELTTDEAIRKLFPKRVVEKVKEKAQEPPKPQVTRPDSSIPGEH